MEVTIRDATEGDADAVAALLADLGYPTSRDAAASHVARFACEPASRLQVADSADGVVGLVATHMIPRLDDDRCSCRITDLVVAASHRRRGVGSALIAAAEREARRSRSAAPRPLVGRMARGCLRVLRAPRLRYALARLHQAALGR